MSFEAVAWVRPTGSHRGHHECEQKWLTVPTEDRTAARDAFGRLGYEVRGMTIMDQDEATRAAERIAGDRGRETVR